jgi:hypothetical protein
MTTNAHRNRALTDASHARVHRTSPGACGRPHERRSQIVDDHAMPIDLPPDYDEFKAEVFADQGRDAQGVYEVWWLANTRYPDLAASSRLAIAESVVRDLVSERRIALVRSDWIGADHDRGVVLDPQAALLAWDTWVPQPGEAVTWMSDV